MYLESMAILLPAIVLAAVAAASPFDGCTAAKSHGGWTYTCEEMQVIVQDTDGPAIAATNAVEVSMQALASSRPGTSRSRERWRLAGKDTQVLKIVIPNERAVAFGTEMARPEGSRAVFCYTRRDPGQCHDVLSQLSDRPWRSGPETGAKANAPSPLTLAGQTVSVPQGCRSETTPNGGGNVSCSPGTFARWMFAPDSATAKIVLDATVKKLSDLYEGIPAKVIRGTVGCSLAGVETSCQRMQVQPGDPSGVTVLSGLVPSGQGVLYAVCIAPGTTGAALPCALVIRPKK